jgi:hypothetical protein
MRLLCICLELRLEGSELGKRRIGIGLLLALPARPGIPAILGVEPAVLLAAIRIAMVPATPLLPATLLAAVLLAPFLTPLLIPPFLIAPFLIASLLAVLAEGRSFATASLAARFGPPLAVIAGLPTLALALAEFARRTAPVPALVGLPLLCPGGRRLAVRSGDCAIGRRLRPVAMLAMGGTARTTALLAAAARTPNLDQLRLGRRGGSLGRPISRRRVSYRPISRCSFRRGRHFGGLRRCRRLRFRFGRGNAR